MFVQYKLEYILYFCVDPADLQMDVEKVVRRMGESGNVTLDKMMLSALNKLTSEVNQSMFPYGLQKPFPKNCLTLMTATGAKGSDVSLFFQQGQNNVIFCVELEYIIR
jgi:hypothetical protein